MRIEVINVVKSVVIRADASELIGRFCANAGEVIQDCIKKSDEGEQDIVSDMFRGLRAAGDIHNYLTNDELNIGMSDIEMLLSDGMFCALMLADDVMEYISEHNDEIGDNFSLIVKNDLGDGRDYIILGKAIVW